MKTLSIFLYQGTKPKLIYQIEYQNKQYFQLGLIKNIKNCLMHQL